MMPGETRGKREQSLRCLRQTQSSITEELHFEGDREVKGELAANLQEENRPIAKLQSVVDDLKDRVVKLEQQADNADAYKI